MGEFSDRYEGLGWIKVGRHEPSRSANWSVADSVNEEYARLEAHHERETEFLIGEVRRLAELLDEELARKAGPT